MSSLTKTWILNALFIYLVPVLLTIFTQNEFFIFPYVASYTVIEILWERRNAEISRTRLFFVYWITLAYNFLLLFSCSWLVVTLFRMEFSHWITHPLILAFLFFMSKIEVAIDNRIYRVSQ